MSPAGYPSSLAEYACRPWESRGRLHDEPDSATRSCFQRDRDRIIHSVAFRRLKHKTQVFVYHEGDHYRTRLTHSIEVAQIARTLCRSLRLNEDLAEALSLAHDLGHTCFGHAGEEALDAAMAEFGGFDHNEQTFRLVTQLERRYAAFDGLNLTWECLEGLVKHNGPLAGSRAAARYQGRPVPASIRAFDSELSLEIKEFASGEAQVAALSDDIAYTNHDIDDGLRARLFKIEDLCGLPLIKDLAADIEDRYPNLEQARFIHELVRQSIGAMADDLLSETRRRLNEHQPTSVEALRALPTPVVAFSEPTEAAIGALRAFLFEHMYRHKTIKLMIAQAKEVVGALFAHYQAHPEALPERWRRAADGQEDGERARLVADYIAGMTDRFALQDYERLFQRRVIH